MKYYEPLMNYNVCCIMFVANVLYVTIMPMKIRDDKKARLFTCLQVVFGLPV